MLFFTIVSIIFAINDDEMSIEFCHVEDATKQLICQLDSIFNSVDCMRRLSQSAKQVCKYPKPTNFEFKKNPWIVLQIPENIEYYYGSLQHLSDNIGIFQMFFELSGLNKEMDVDMSYMEAIKKHMEKKQSMSDYIMKKYYNNHSDGIFLTMSRIITLNISKAMLSIRQLYYCVENGRIVDVCFIRRELIKHKCDKCEAKRKTSITNSKMQV
ncbi:hypothetical protein THOM_1862 [Trachipleistophora hominis]|uniref:Uncharacterized protein n=1 Tax=Trachipleistophora hominis TaxID=72359 RepID=L7JV07_TRAHO|nr:hypothetical protein THOM_1862 [Trachipleistophora hominis]